MKSYEAAQNWARAGAGRPADHPGLSVEENLQARRIAPNPGWEIERVYELFPRLGERRKQEGTTLSGGEQQMLAIGRALVRQLKLLLLDEPYEGLAPVIVDEIGPAQRHQIAGHHYGAGRTERAQGPCARRPGRHSRHRDRRVRRLGPGGARQRGSAPRIPRDLTQGLI
ncbi:MAG: ATP-binding cassette domain-containing protein [Paracoccaceae bacterium]